MPAPSDAAFSGLRPRSYFAAITMNRHRRASAYARWVIMRAFRLPATDYDRKSAPFRHRSRGVGRYARPRRFDAHGSPTMAPASRLRRASLKSDKRTPPRKRRSISAAAISADDFTAELFTFFYIWPKIAAFRLQRLPRRPAHFSCFLMQLEPLLISIMIDGQQQESSPSCRCAAVGYGQFVSRHRRGSLGQI